MQTAHVVPPAMVMVILLCMMLGLISYSVLGRRGILRFCMIYELIVFLMVMHHSLAVHSQHGAAVCLSGVEIPDWLSSPYQWGTSYWCPPCC